jgi:hypothetical protein
MKTKIILLVVAGSLMTFFSLVPTRSQSYLAQETSPAGTQHGVSGALHELIAGQDESPRYAQLGDIGVGSVVFSSSDELRLDMSPCDDVATIVVFRKPFERSTKGQRTCNGKTVTIEQVQQF